MHNQDELLQFLKSLKKVKSVELYCDIETLKCNKIEGAKHATKYHSHTYSLAIAWFYEGALFPSVAVFNNFIDFFTKVKQAKIRKGLAFDMIFHNGDKFDNHFMLYELHHYFNFPIRTLHNKACNNEYNDEALRLSDLSSEDKQGIILESRIKSSNNVSVTSYVYGRKVTLIDSFKKMNVSIKQLGIMMLNRGFIEEQYLKTNFDYSCFDREEDISDNEVLPYVKRCFESLNEKQLVYIRNDVIILALGVKHYVELFYGFDFSKMTFTQNIKEEYANYNELAEFQLLKKRGRFDHIALGDYNICGLNGFDYFRRYYKGGLNLYNDKYVGKLLNREGFSIDLNSSYPTVMYKEKLPTYLVNIIENPVKVSLPYEDRDYMTFFTMTINNANKFILSNIKSRVLRNAIVKYYNSKDGLVYYNTVFLSLIAKITGHKFGKLPVESLATFKCKYFGARDVIARNYYIKTQGKAKLKLDCEIDTINPLDIHMTDQPKPQEYNFSPDMVQGSKVLLNGIYGVPALRLFFDAFYRTENGEYINAKDGFTNKERNIVFSAGVTAFAFRNLLTPLSYLTQEEIDEYFWYADTDSLYLDKRAKAKFPQSMYHKMNLGAWDIEHDNITQFYAFNHKKYCLYDNEIVVRCGGVSKDEVKRWKESSNDDIERFITFYFSDGVQIPTTRSIRNEQNTIAIYEAYAELKQGQPYLDHYSHETEKEIKKLAVQFRDELMEEEGLYIESPYGAVGINDLIEMNPNEVSPSIKELVREYRKMERQIKTA